MLFDYSSSTAAGKEPGNEKPPAFGLDLFGFENEYRFDRDSSLALTDYSVNMFPMTEGYEMFVILSNFSSPFTELPPPFNLFDMHFLPDLSYPVPSIYSDFPKYT
jgi:hypothetical protein